MALVDIVYVHSKDPVAPEGIQYRKNSVTAMEEYVERLVLEMKMAGVSTSFRSETKDGARNDIIINGRTVAEILDGLQIVRPELDSEGRPASIVTFERAPDDWHEEIIEDIPDLLLKNALSKAYADADKLRIKNLLNEN
ncbi:MAG: hypothetical protein MJZ38_02160 [archaeon]|nr:hypothetical protein [archaeon]